MKFKRLLLAAALVGVAGAANAGGLVWHTDSTASRDQLFNPFLNGSPTLPSGILPDYGATVASGGSTAAAHSTVDLGHLTSSGGSVTFTYLGSEAGYNDNITLLLTGDSLHDQSPKALTGDSKSETVAAGLVPFEFQGDVAPHTLTTKIAVNGGTVGGPIATSALWAHGPSFQTSIGLIGTNMKIGSVTYQYVIGYNDSAGDTLAFPSADWDDMVIGVNAVPEPEVYAMLAAGLGLMGFVARRRKQLGSAV